MSCHLQHHKNATTSDRLGAKQECTGRLYCPRQRTAAWILRMLEWGPLSLAFSILSHLVPPPPMNCRAARRNFHMRFQGKIHFIGSLTKQASSTALIRTTFAEMLSTFMGRRQIFKNKPYLQYRGQNQKVIKETVERKRVKINSKKATIKRVKCIKGRGTKVLKKSHKISGKRTNVERHRSNCE